MINAMRHFYLFFGAALLALAGGPCFALDPTLSAILPGGAATAAILQNSALLSGQNPALLGGQLGGQSPNSPPAQQTQPVAPAQPSAPVSRPASRMFGNQLFNGTFSSLGGGGFNPDYRINIGDRVQIRIWGAFNFDGQAIVDSQGNIFLPNVGPVTIAGTPNSALNTLISAQVHRVYKANVGIYVSLDLSQPVKVFVTGFVRQPGLYGGVASESLLSFLDRAGGVDPDKGSYLDVSLRRGEKVIKHVNLYDFLLYGQTEYLQLQNGDTIVVGSRKYSFSAAGQIYNEYEFEIGQPEIPIQRVIELAKPKPGATHVSILRGQGKTIRSEYYPLDRLPNVTVQAGDTATFTSDRYTGTIEVRVEGAHSGQHALVLPYGATMKEVLAQIKPNSMSRMDAIQIFRKSVAKRQKEMLAVALNKLEESFLSARSATIEVARLRTEEAALIGKFVEKARQVEPKGQVILDEKTLADTILEDDDIIRIPERTSLVTLNGEVVFPNAVSWRGDLDVDDYINAVGGYTHTASTSKVVVIHPNGQALTTDNLDAIVAGDEIIVLPQIESKNFEIARAISTIIYQIAIAARVVVGL